MFNFNLVSLAFSAGLASFLNPCSFALLPSYLSYFLGRNEKDVEAESTVKNLLRGIKYGLTASLGFAVVFLCIGVLVSLIGSQIQTFMPPLLLLVGGILIVLGIFWILDRPILYLTKFSNKIQLPKTSFFLFGMAYALSSVACAFPVFLMVIFSALGTGEFIPTMVVFLAFTGGMGFFMVIISVAMALSKGIIVKKLESARKYVTKVAGIILLVAGIYLIYYWGSTLWA